MLSVASWSLCGSLEALKDRQTQGILLALEQLMAEPGNLPLLVELDGVQKLLDCLKKEIR